MSDRLTPEQLMVIRERTEAERDRLWEMVKVADEKREEALRERNAAYDQNLELESCLATDRYHAKQTQEQVANLEAERDRIATDILVALAKAGVATPARGYAVEPHLIAEDIAKLAKERDDARRERDSANSFMQEKFEDYWRLSCAIHENLFVGRLPDLTEIEELENAIYEARKVIDILRSERDDFRSQLTASKKREAALAAAADDALDAWLSGIPGEIEKPMRQIEDLLRGVNR